MSIDRLTNRPIDMPINIIEEKVYLNKRITPEEAIELFIQMIYSGSAEWPPMLLKKKQKECLFYS